MASIFDRRPASEIIFSGQQNNVPYEIVQSDPIDVMADFLRGNPTEPSPYANDGRILLRVHEPNRNVPTGITPKLNPPVNGPRRTTKIDKPLEPKVATPSPIVKPVAQSPMSGQVSKQQLDDAAMKAYLEEVQNSVSGDSIKQVLEKARALSSLNNMRQNNERVDFSPLKRLVDRQEEAYALETGRGVPSVGVDDPTSRPLSPEELKLLRNKANIDQLNASLGIANLGETVTSGAVKDALSQAILGETVRKNSMENATQLKSIQAQYDIAQMKGEVAKDGDLLSNSEAIELHKSFLKDKAEGIIGDDISPAQYAKAANDAKANFKTGGRANQIETYRNQFLEAIGR
jgi:hypothetical protein